MNFAVTIGKRSLRISTGTHREPAPRPDVGARMFAAAQTSRLTADWPVTLTSADAEILTSAIATRSRLRAAERDDDYMRRMLRLLENNVVGESGIKLRMNLRDSADKLDRERNSIVEEAWLDYLQEENCTVMRNVNGQQVQRLAIRSLARDGPILFRKHRPFTNSFFYGLEPIESDRLDHWWNRPAVGTANQIKFGIEMDSFHAPLAYWILSRHPGEIFAYSSSPRYRERVPADEIIAMWTIERAGQTIGMPLWPSIAKRLHNLYKYEEAEQIACRAASAKGGWFKRIPASGEYVGPQDQQGNTIVNTEPGQWEELPIGWEPVMNDPHHPTDAFPHFVKSQLRGASAGAGLPYNSVASDLEAVSYSAYKAGMNDARDDFKDLQALLVRKLMRPWFRDWVSYAMLAGKIALPMTMLSEIRVADCWKARRWAGLEPLKEAQAHGIAVQMGFDSRRNIIEEAYDGQIEEVYDQQEHDNQLAIEHGLHFEEVKKPIIGGAPTDADTARGNGHGRLARLVARWKAQGIDLED